jgi:hypothetical protein
MKKVIFYLMMSLLVVAQACKTKETTLDEMLEIANANVLLQGNFQSAVHPTTGIAKVITENGKRMLVFENFKTDPGPNLKVYLATTTSPSNFTDLGALKASSGNFAYEISASVNLDQQSNVLVWCERFSVLFGNASLKK